MANKENRQIFNEENLKRMSSPEDLDSYVKVVSPSVWILITAIIVLLAGATVWGFCGRLNTIVYGAAIIKTNKIDLYVNSDASGSIDKGQTVKINGASYTIDGVDDNIFDAREHLNDYAISVGKLDKAGDTDNEVWVIHASIDPESCTEKDRMIGGTYVAAVYVESIKPASFLTGK